MCRLFFGSSQKKPAWHCLSVADQRSLVYYLEGQMSWTWRSILVRPRQSSSRSEVVSISLSQPDSVYPLNWLKINCGLAASTTRIKILWADLAFSTSPINFSLSACHWASLTAKLSVTEFSLWLRKGDVIEVSWPLIGKYRCNVFFCCPLLFPAKHRVQHQLFGSFTSNSNGSKLYLSRLWTDVELAEEGQQHELSRFGIFTFQHVNMRSSCMRADSLG